MSTTPTISPAKKPLHEPVSQISLCDPILMAQALAFAHIHTLEFNLSVQLDPKRSSFEHTAWLFSAEFVVNEDVWGWPDRYPGIAEAMDSDGTEAVRRALENAERWMREVDTMPILPNGVEVLVQCETTSDQHDKYSATILKDGKLVEEVTQPTHENWFWPAPANHAGHRRAIELFGHPQ